MQLIPSYRPFYSGWLFFIALLFACSTTHNQQDEVFPANGTTLTNGNEFRVIAYYTGNPDSLNAKTLESLTHIIYSYAHLQGNQLVLKEARDTTALTYLASLKQQYPHLKVLVALGGWGGCETCSTVFASEEDRTAFATSTKVFLDSFGIDGLDLNWKYPAHEDFPDPPYSPQDRENFSMLIEELRQTLSWGYTISVAAGGFPLFLEESINWARTAPLLNWINVMSYDLVNGNSPRTGHHTPLYSTHEQLESTQQVVHYLDSVGVERNKIVIGAAFYACIWEGVPAGNRGLYQPGTFKESILYNQLQTYTGFYPGFETHWDSVAQAPFQYNPNQKVFATYDDPPSLAIKTRYALAQGLGGIMFWQLSGDTPEGDLLQAIYRVKKENIP